ALAPAGDPPLGVEHEDRVAGNVDEQPEPLLALAHLILGSLPVGEVPGDLAESDQPAVLTTEDGDDLVGPVAAAVHPHAPAFILETSGRRRHRQLLIGLASLNVLGRIAAP